MEKKLTINDIFKYKKQALLVATMQGDKSVEFFEKVFKDLREDLGASYRYRPKETRLRTRVHYFKKLTPYYKAFGIKSQNQMAEILMTAQNNSIRLAETDKRRALKRHYTEDLRPVRNNSSNGFNKHGQAVACTNKSRLTPLPKTLYRMILIRAIIKRIGILGLNQTEYINLYHTFTNVYADAIHSNNRFIVPVIADGDLQLMYYGESINSYEQFQELTLKNNGSLRRQSKMKF